jgi:hypothetical protein
MNDGDREYTALFLIVDIEMAIADAGLGNVDAAFKRLDGLLERFRNVDHPLVHGDLHDARARIAWAAGREADYGASRAEVERFFRPTQNPALIAKCERLAELAGSNPAHSRSRGQGATTTGMTSVRREGTLVTGKAEGREDVQTVRVSTRRIDSA